MKYLHQTGDTIVEVLIAIAVVSIVLGGAYATSTRSLNNVRQAQERGEALKLAEGQLERLKIVAQPGTTAFTTTDLFCINSANAVVTATNPTINMGAVPPLQSDTTFGTYVADCRAGSGVTYQISISRTDDATGSTFTARTRWDRAGSSGKDEVAITYRVAR